LKITIDPFIASLIAILVLAFLLAQFGIDVSGWYLSEIGTVGIGLIFFLYGLKLNLATLRSDLSNWRLHVFVQTSTFLVFPLILLPFYLVFVDTDYYMAWLALFFMSCLPSTVSSSVIMVSIAKGNVPAAIFNATTSGLLGIVLTPLWFGSFIASSGESIGYFRLFSGILFQVIIPVTVGVLLRPYIHVFVDAQKSKLGIFDKSIILLIIFKSFASSFAHNIFREYSIFVFMAMLCCDILVFTAMFFLLGNVANHYAFSREDVTVAQFCGSQKSLIHGTVFASLLFPPHFPVGLLLVPVMFYHAFQLMFVSFVAHKRSIK